MRISDWSSDVCSSDRPTRPRAGPRRSRRAASTRRWSSRPCATCARLDARESGMTIRIALAQFDFAVGAVARNADRIAAMIVEARDLHRADVVLFPELSLSGYPPEDLLARPQFLLDCDAALQRIAEGVAGIVAMVGWPDRKSVV